MKRIILAIFTFLSVSGHLVAAELTENELFKVFVSKDVETKPQAIQAIEEIVKNGVTAKASTHIAAVGAANLPAWVVDTQIEEFRNALRDIAKRVDELAPTNPSDRNVLLRQQTVVKSFRVALDDFYRTLHSKAPLLISAFSKGSPTTMNAFAVFWLQTLPDMRSELSNLESKIHNKLSQPLPAQDPLDSYQDVKSVPSVAWAWEQFKRFNKLNKEKDSQFREEAKQIDAWAKSVLDNLPSKKTKKIEVATYGAYKALRNTIDIYLRNVAEK